MKIRTSCVVAVFASAFSMAAAAAADGPAATPGKVIRHLSFSVSAGTAQTLETTRTTALSSGSGAGGAYSVGGSDTSSSHTTIKASVTIDVIGVLANDHALAALVSESGDTVLEPQRVDIMGDGRVLAPIADRSKVSPEQMEIAALCARDVFAGHDLTPGTVWNVDGTVGGVKSHANYRVLSLNPDGRAALIIERTLTGGGVRAIDQRSTTNVTYDTTRAVPTSVTIARRQHLGSLGDLRTIDESFEYHLIEDSLAKK